MSEQTPTERLRAMLDERGVEYEVIEPEDGDGGGFMWPCEAAGAYAVATFNSPDSEYLHLGFDRLITPEQAIAATLGNDREQRLEKLVRVYGEISNYFCERFACCDTEFANCKYCIGLPQGGQCELGWCNDESKALGIEQPDYGGGECEPVNLQELYDKLSELENELAMLRSDKLTAEQVSKAVYAHSIHADCADADWQAIADELNATLGGGECEIETTESWLPAERYHRCKHCGAFFAVMNASGDIPPCACPNCGKAVKR